MSYQGGSAFGGGKTAVSSSVPLAPNNAWTSSLNNPLSVHDFLSTFIYNPRRNFVFVDEFMGGTAGNFIGWSLNTSGSGSFSTNSYGVGTGNALGVGSIRTGTTGGSFANLRQSNLAFDLGTVTLSWEARVGVSQLSTSTDRYHIAVGFLDTNATADDGVDSVAFRYQDDVNSGNWQVFTRSNSVETSVDTSIAPVTGGNFQRLRMDIDGSVPVARFYINDALVGTITTNVPTGSARITGLSFRIWKIAGTADVGLNPDYVYVVGTFLNPR